MVKCTFCKNQILPGRGRMFVETSGKIHNFCSSKCRKNLDLGRDPNKLKWTAKDEEQVQAQK